MLFLIAFFIFSYCPPDTVLIFREEEHPEMKMFEFMDRYESLDEMGKMRMMSGGAAWGYEFFANDDGTYAFAAEYPAVEYILHNNHIMAILPHAILSHFGGHIGVAFMGNYAYFAGRMGSKKLYRVEIPSGKVDTFYNIRTGGFVFADHTHRYLLLGGVPDDIAKKLNIPPESHTTIYTEDLKPVGVLYGGRFPMSSEVTYAFGSKVTVYKPTIEDKGFIKVYRMQPYKVVDTKKWFYNIDGFFWPLGMDKYNNLYLPATTSLDKSAVYILRITPEGDLTGWIKINRYSTRGEWGVDKDMSVSPGGSVYRIRIDGKKGHLRIVILKWDKEKFNHLCR